MEETTATLLIFLLILLRKSCSDICIMQVLLGCIANLA